MILIRPHIDPTTQINPEQLLKAREYYEDNAVVPPIRKFAKYMGADQKEIFKMWMTGPMFKIVWNNFERAQHGP